MTPFPAPQLKELRTSIFADGADRATIASLYGEQLVQGFTTNPTLMRAAGVSDYERFARDILEVVPDLPVSFEVLSDEFAEMERQAHEIASWGDNVYVKIPVTNARGDDSGPLLRRLAAQGLHLNVTALMAPRQVEHVIGHLADGVPAFVSLFAGRIADTGRDPVPLVSEALEILRGHDHVRLIWASPREVLNVFQASAVGCHVITMTPDLLGKLPLVGRDLEEFSLATVRMFLTDAVAAGFSL